MAKHGGLGRGLGGLIKDAAAAAQPPAPKPQESAATGAGPARIPVDAIRKSPWQPRRRFDEAALAELASSVRERGVLQPLLVRRAGATYELIAGERRFRAAQEAGLGEVPAVILDVTDREALELALVENLQRADLNLIEEAEGYRALGDKFQLTQEQIAERVGKARATVANALRLLELPDLVKRMLAEGQITPGHAKALLGIDGAKEREALALRVLAEGLSVRQVEKAAAAARRVPRKPRAEKSDIPADHVRHVTELLHQRLGTAIRLTPCRTLANGKKAKGAIEIDYYSSDDLDRILVILGIAGDL